MSALPLWLNTVGLGLDILGFSILFFFALPGVVARSLIGDGDFTVDGVERTPEQTKQDEQSAMKAKRWDRVSTIGHAVGLGLVAALASAGIRGPQGSMRNYALMAGKVLRDGADGRQTEEQIRTVEE